MSVHYFQNDVLEFGNYYVAEGDVAQSGTEETNKLLKLLGYEPVVDSHGFIIQDKFKGPIELAHKELFNKFDNGQLHLSSHGKRLLNTLEACE